MTQPLRYAINTTLDGCCHHEAGLPPDAESMAFWTDELRRSDTLLYGRVTYELMEGAWRRPESGEWPDWMDDSEMAFSEVMDPMRKVVASGTLDAVDWNAELVRDDVVDAVDDSRSNRGGALRSAESLSPRRSRRMGSSTSTRSSCNPVIAGRGPRLLDGVDLKLELVEQRTFASGAIVQRYRPVA